VPQRHQIDNKEIKGASDIAVDLSYSRLSHPLLPILVFVWPAFAYFSVCLACFCLLLSLTLARRLLNKHIAAQFSKHKLGLSRTDK
jgi:hypothetical protein